MAQHRIHLVDEDSTTGNVYQGGVPAVRPNWRPQPYASPSRSVTATYEVIHHAPRLLDMAAVGLKRASNRFGELSADDPPLAEYFSQWEKRLANVLIYCVEDYAYRSTY